MSKTGSVERDPERIDGVPVTSGTVQAALADDGSGLELTATLARRLGVPHAGADGRHADEPAPFRDGDPVGTVGAVCALARVRPDAGEAGLSAIHKAPLEGPSAVNRLGVVGDQQGDHAHHGGRDKALYVLDAAEQRHWAAVLGGIAPGSLGENLTIEPGPAGGIDDVEIGAVLSIGDPRGEGLRVRVTGVRNPCATFARGVGRGDWVEVFSSRNRVGVYLAVLKEGTVRAGDEVRVVSAPGHRVTCTRWFAHHDPRDAQRMLDSEIFGNCVIAPFTKKYVQAAAHEQVG
ncbi:MOSC domain-containing protein [Actinomyces sp. 432]|uniref:MOSC domain-containing protein n=1 Tax=Actinomyces sp. 432 TaxID=2057798 RepID=UPI00137444EC|nr:MOSC domain-containing protein [Actinomyces sp. 432]QHO91149.1 MOSC domain-containing protein [Actinomyces sp. 432]